MRALCVALVLCAGLSVVPSASRAETDAARAEGVMAAFEHWAQENALNGAIAVLKDGIVLRQLGVGQDANAPVETASLSKAITAICVSELVARGALSYGDSAAHHLGRGPDVTVAQLLTHTAGLGADSTQFSMQVWFGSASPRHARVLEAVMLRPWFLRGRLVPETYHYSNENYALLGLIIEAVSDTSYEQACRDLVLTPAKAAGQPSPLSGAFLPWGGWRMTLADYGRFHATWFGRNNARAQTPLQSPAAKIGSDYYYGLGSIFRSDVTGTHYWHTGALCFPGRLNVGSFAASWANGWTVATSYDKCIDDKPLRQLQRALVNRAYGVGE